MRLTGICMCYYRNFPKKFLEREGKTRADRLIERRFGAPKVEIMEHEPDNYIHTDFHPWSHEEQSLNAMARKRWAMHNEQPRDWMKEQLPVSRRGKDRRWYKRAQITPSQLRNMNLNADDGPASYPQIPDEKWPFRLDDEVMINVGKYKGKIGRVKAIVRATNHIYVEGLNLERSYKEASKAVDTPAYFETREKPYDAARGEISLVDPDKEVPIEVELIPLKDGGYKRRIVSLLDDYNTEHEERYLEIPVTAERCYDYVSKEQYAPNTQKDTTVKDMQRLIAKHAYKPNKELLTFEQEIASLHDIDLVEEEKQRKPSFWY